MDGRIAGDIIKTFPPDRRNGVAAMSRDPAREHDLKRVPSHTVVGRGTGINTPNRFERIHVEPEYEHLDEDDRQQLAHRKTPTKYLVDASQSVVSENNSPDVTFRFSINPYRGCSHGCSYCYARPYHEFLGLSAGLDFESKIIVKPDAPKLFRKWLKRKSWVCEPVNLSGVTDPYQPVERKFEITRGCLKVALDCNQPVYVITKNGLVTRDIDLLEQLASRNLVRVVMTVTSLNDELVRRMEPQTSVPAARIRAIETLVASRIPVLVNVAPIIGGLTDHEVPEILRAVSEAGATSARYTVLRLPGPVEPIFLNWVDEHYPGYRQKIESSVRSMSDGQLLNKNFYDRMRGTGTMASHIRTVFKTFARKYGLDEQPPELDCGQFRRPQENEAQGRLFQDT